MEKLESNIGIYCLIDPRNSELRYIGLSKQLYSRKIQHSNPKIKFYYKLTED